VAKEVNLPGGVFAYFEQHLFESLGAGRLVDTDGELPDRIEGGRDEAGEGDTHLSGERSRS
jgi:hypothetical protein